MNSMRRGLFAVAAVALSVALCDRAYVLENGRVVLEGTGKNLMNDPHVKEAYLGI